MVALTIRCRPCVPVPIAELESWLAGRLEELRAALPRLRVRLLRLSQPLPSDDVEVGWLLEFELPGDQWAPMERRLHATVTDMRLLGLQPTLLEPRDATLGTHGAPESASPPPPPGRRQREPAARGSGERHIATAAP